MTVNKIVPAAIDDRHHRALRKNIEDFLGKSRHLWSGAKRVLEVAPQDFPAGHGGEAGTVWDTLDIDPTSDATIIGDLCDLSGVIADQTYDCVICTEVLEHTRQPWAAAQELYRILKPGGVALITTPFNFRIHGPLPDCWRFTEHGLRQLLSDFASVDISALETPERPLMPIQYCVVAVRGS